jgi:hypothetical protein
MENQTPPSQPFVDPGSRVFEMQPQLTPEQIAQLKERAMAAAVQQTFSAQPQVVYVRRNLTVAEIILVFVLSCGIVTGIQWGWNVVTNVLPRVEIRVR